MKELVPASHCN